MKTKFFLLLFLVLGFVLNSPGQETAVKERPQITVNVLGEVKKPARITLPNDGTILDALATAGDVTPDGDLHHVRLLHKTTSDKANMTEVNVTNILNGKATNVVLRDGDTVQVSKKLYGIRF